VEFYDFAALLSIQQQNIEKQIVTGYFLPSPCQSPGMRIEIWLL